MTEEQSPQALKAMKKVSGFRVQRGEELAIALEELASALMKEADVINAAEALEEAAEIWAVSGMTERQGSCLLLSVSSRRLAGDLMGAKKPGSWSCCRYSQTTFKWVKS